MSNAIDQTRRMLSLVTYLRERPGARVSEVARAFGVTEAELIGDLNVLPLCGTSFRGGDLLDIDTDGERIWWHNPGTADDVAQPLRLASDEATALLVAARAVANLPGLRDRDRQALLRAGAKLEAAAGEVAGASAQLSVTFEAEGSVFATVDRAITEQRLLWIRYYSPARDALTEREVDPIRLFAVGHTYFEGWSPAVGGPPYLPARPGRRDPAARRALRPAADRAARPVAGPGPARGRRPRGGHRGRARRTLGRRVLPARQRRGTARRRAADHPAHPRPGVAA